MRIIYFDYKFLLYLFVSIDLYFKNECNKDTKKCVVSGV